MYTLLHDAAHAQLSSSPFLSLPEGLLSVPSTHQALWASAYIYLCLKGPRLSNCMQQLQCYHFRVITSDAFFNHTINQVTSIIFYHQESLFSSRHLSQFAILLFLFPYQLLPLNYKLHKSSNHVCLFSYILCTLLSTQQAFNKY